MRAVHVVVTLPDATAASGREPADEVCRAMREGGRGVIEHVHASGVHGGSSVTLVCFVIADTDAEAVAAVRSVLATAGLVRLDQRQRYLHLASLHDGAGQTLPW